MRNRTIFLALLCLFVGATGVFAKSGPLVLPVGGNFIDSSGGTGTFTGQFALVEFAGDNNQVVANGFVSGVLTDSRGKVLGSVIRHVTMPVAVSSSASTTGRVSSLSIEALATCPILHLDLGPLSLNLLGLQVNLSQVVLDISAQSGPGNLLGNLLCAVANLLNGTSVTTLVNLLNQILQAIVNLL